MKSTHSPEGRARRSSCRRAALVLVAVALVAGADAQTPIDPSELVAPAVEVSGGNVNFTVRSSVAGRRYQLQSSGSMASDSWANVGGERTGDGDDLLIATPRDPTVPSRLYRLALDPPVFAPEGFVLIPAGSFTMGRTSGDTGSDAPPVTVNVSAFYMAKYEVTKALWDEVRTWGLANGYTDLSVGGGKESNHPVHTNSWFDMVKWCNARSQKEGLTPVYTVGGAVMRTGTTAPAANWSANGYRLPTEAEWEKAARGGVSGKRFPWGTDTISHSQANYHASSTYIYDLSGAVLNFHPTYATGSSPYTSPVGSFAPNGYGLHDMAGNVWELCWDLYGALTYVNGATDPRGAASGTIRVARGGSWANVASSCRAALRDYDDPSGTADFIGFRLARSSVP